MNQLRLLLKCVECRHRMTVIADEVRDQPMCPQCRNVMIVQRATTIGKVKSETMNRRNLRRR